MGFSILCSGGCGGGGGGESASAPLPLRPEKYKKISEIFFLSFYSNFLSNKLYFHPGEGGGGALDSHFNGGDAGGGGGVKTAPCLKPLGAQKIHPVTIYLTKNFHMHTLYWYGRTFYSAVYHLECGILPFLIRDAKSCIDCARHIKDDPDLQ